MKRNILIVTAILLCFNLIAQEEGRKEIYQNGKDFGFEFSGGIHGLYGDWSIGVVFPKIKNIIGFGLKAIHSTTYIKQIIFYPSGLLRDKYTGMTVSGNVSMSSGSPLLFGFLRMYGIAEFSFGYSFTPTMTNSYGHNFTFGGFGYGGLEFYPGRWSSFFIEIGGGGSAIFGEADNPYIDENGSIGSGFAVRAGTRIFIAKKEKKVEK